MITIEENTVLRDGKKVGELTAEGDFLPVEGLHHKTAEKIAKEIDALKQGGQEASRLAHTQENAGSNPAPATKPAKAQKGEAPPQSPRAGDKTPEYVEWYRANHTEAEFLAKYGHRVIPGGVE